MMFALNNTKSGVVRSKKAAGASANTLRPLRNSRRDCIATGLARDGRSNVSPDRFDEFREVSNWSRRKQVHRMHAEHAIALELRLTEELVRRALVREGLVRFEVLVDIAGLIAVTRRLDVNDHAFRCLSAIDVLVANPPERGVTTRSRTGMLVVASVYADLVELD